MFCLSTWQVPYSFHTHAHSYCVQGLSFKYNSDCSPGKKLCPIVPHTHSGIGVILSQLTVFKLLMIFVYRCNFIAQNVYNVDMKYSYTCRTRNNGYWFLRGVILYHKIITSSHSRMFKDEILERLSTRLEG